MPQKLGLVAKECDREALPCKIQFQSPRSYSKNCICDCGMIYLSVWQFLPSSVPVVPYHTKTSRSEATKRTLAIGTKLKLFSLRLWDGDASLQMLIVFFKLFFVAWGKWQWQWWEILPAALSWPSAHIPVIPVIPGWVPARGHAQLEVAQWNPARPHTRPAAPVPCYPCWPLPPLLDVLDSPDSAYHHFHDIFMENFIISSWFFWFDRSTPAQQWWH